MARESPHNAGRRVRSEGQRLTPQNTSHRLVKLLLKLDDQIHHKRHAQKPKRRRTIQSPHKGSTHAAKHNIGGLWRPPLLTNPPLFTNTDQKQSRTLIATTWIRFYLDTIQLTANKKKKSKAGGEDRLVAVVWRFCGFRGASRRRHKANAATLVHCAFPPVGCNAQHRSNTDTDGSCKSAHAPQSQTLAQTRNQPPAPPPLAARAVSCASEHVDLRYKKIDQLEL